MRTEQSSRIGAFAVALGSVLLCAVGLGLVLLIAWTPAYVGFALAITAAVCWCIWIERHPST